MKLIFSALSFLVIFASCAQTQSADVKSGPVAIPAGIKQKPSANEAVATFAEGCFWHSEIVFQSLVGVRDAVSGYAGGTSGNPDYELVSSGTTGHAESVQVYYDPSIISFETLVAAFFASQDPTQVNGQGPDEGPQYRSIAFYRNQKEKEIIDAEIKRLTDSRKYSHKIVTEVKPFTQFYPAEDYHQEYILKHPGNPYVQNVSIPEFLKFKREFKANYKS